MPNGLLGRQSIIPRAYLSSMDVYIDGYFSSEYIKILLVKGGIKPACTIEIHEDLKSPEEAEQWFESLGLHFIEKHHTPINKEHAKIHRYLVAKEEKILDDLPERSAKVGKSYAVAFGISMGYPLDAVKALVEKSLSAAQEEFGLHEQQVQMLLEGNEYPEWCYYLSHVPAYCNILEGKVAESSIAQATLYMQYIRENHLDVAKLHEEIERKKIQMFAQDPIFLKRLSEKLKKIGKPNEYKEK